MLHRHKTWAIAISTIVIVTMLWSLYCKAPAPQLGSNEEDTQGIIIDNEPELATPEGTDNDDTAYLLPLTQPQVEIGELYYITVPVELSIGSGTFAPCNIIASKDTVKTIELVQDERFGFLWALVKSKNVEGWVPIWYLTSEAHAELPELPSVPMVVADDSWLQPLPYNMGEFSPLYTGKVVQVFSVHEEWSYVQSVVYEYSYSYGWVQTKDLIPFSPELSREGIVRAGAHLYTCGDNGPDLTSYDTAIELKVFIVESQGDYAHIVALGGLDRWVHMDNIISYNPWTK